MRRCSLRPFTMVSRLYPLIVPDPTSDESIEFFKMRILAGKSDCQIWFELIHWQHQSPSKRSRFRSTVRPER